jgi:hypothetical protein
MKRLLFVFILFLLTVAGLQLFGDRDFSQVSIAWDKYQYGGTISSFSSDIGDIFAGKTINQGGLATAKMSEHVIYRWTDEFGVVHNSERMPKVGKYEVIRMGDLKIETQEALEEEEIKKALKN